MRINYFGKPFSFTHVAALKRFGSKHTYKSIATIRDTIESSRVTINSVPVVSVVPIENTTGGFIHDTVETLTMEKYLLSDLVILEELELTIKLFLLGNSTAKLSKVKKVYSHIYALRRAEDWIRKNIPHPVNMVQVVSTTEATHRIKNEKYACAIASSEAAAHYKLKKLAEITTGGKKNLTRFFVLGRDSGYQKRI